MLVYGAMEIELKEINEFPAELKLFEKPQDLQFEIEGVRFVNGVSIGLSIQKTDHEYFVNGSCAAEIQMVCARCLTNATLKISGDLSIIAQLDEPGRSRRRPGRPGRSVRSGRIDRAGKSSGRGRGRGRSEQSDDRFGDSEGLVQLDQGERLILVEPVRQALFADIPLKPLCREDCKGLCQKCGVNLNDTTCACDKGAGDSRWDGLNDLHKQNGNV